MSLVLTMPRAFTSADDAARALVARVTRWALIALGVAIVLAGVAIAPLPGPGGLPVIVVGLTTATEVAGTPPMDTVAFVAPL